MAASGKIVQFKCNDQWFSITDQWLSIADFFKNT